MKFAAIVALSLGFSAACANKGGAPSGEPTPRVAPQVAKPDRPPSSPREARLAEAVLTLLESQHLVRRRVDDKVSEVAFARYVEALDPGKAFLLASDAESLDGFKHAIDDQLRSGELELAHAGRALFEKRLAVVEKMVADLLAAKLDLENDEQVETDPEKLTLAATDDELRERWRGRLELEVLERITQMEERAKALAEASTKGGKRDAKKKKEPTVPLTAGQPAEAEENDDGTPALAAGEIPPTLEGRERKARADLAKTYAGRFARLRAADPLDAAATLIEAVTSTFDPHTNYLPPADKANFGIQMSGSLEGIGAVLREDDQFIRVVEIVPGGASWRQGQLQAGDLIMAVSQEGKEPVDVGDMPIDQVVAMIRGPKGTKVTLTLQRQAGDISTLTITRDKVVIEEAFARAAIVKPRPGAAPLGYIYLPSFYGGQGDGRRSSASDVRQILEEMSDKKVAGVVLDLRGNGGGLLDDARIMTGLFIDTGPVVQTMLPEPTEEDPSLRDRLEVLSDDEKGSAFAGPVVVMTDRFSASASEIVAGALQDYHRAVVVGTGPTHGKGTVQVLASLDRGLGDDGEPIGDLKLTVQQFFRVTGASTQWQGVEPDITLPDPAGFLETGERYLDNAIPWSKVDGVKHDAFQPDYTLSDLAAASEKRRLNHKAFGKISARSDLLKVRREESKVQIGRAAWLANRAKQRADLEAVTPDLDKGKANLKVTVLDYDGKARAATRPGGQADTKADRWQATVARDPWVEEALLVLRDMTVGKVAATTRDAPTGAR